MGELGAGAKKEVELWYKGRNDQGLVNPVECGAHVGFISSHVLLCLDKGGLA